VSDVGRAAAAIYQMDWRRILITNKDGNPRPLLANALTALRNDPAWQGVLAFNEFAVRIEIQSRTPWGKEPGEQWTDNDDRLTSEWLQKESITVTTNVAGEAVQTVAMEHAFHPVRDYLNGLKWDEKPRLRNWVNTYLGVDPDKDIARAFGFMWMISAVARIFEPGCKADCCLILEGPQGIGKSTSLRVLSTPWFTDQLAELGTKDASMQCHGVWIVELAELDSINRSETSRIKAFMSATFDRFRLPYGKNVTQWPRGCVFAGSTNKDDYLRDETGARRFWPIKCTAVDVKALERDRDHLWAEAVHLYRGRKEWWLTDDTDITAAEAEQAARFEVDPWAEKISAFIQSRDEVTIGDVLTNIGKHEGQWTRADEMRVSAFLKSRKWAKVRTEVRTEVGTLRPWVYRRDAE
jgi:predicted P-loop ATPase